MPRNYIDLLMPAHNEAMGIEHSLNSALSRIQEVDHSIPACLTVIANGCTDNTSEVADAWGSQNIPKSDRRISFCVIEAVQAHKLHAINIGLEAAENDITFVMDADTTLDRFAISGLLEILSPQRPLGASLYHAAHPNFLPRTALAEVIQMGDLRRQAIPQRWKMHGGFMGWNRHATLDDRQVRFPADQPVTDDTWLSYALIDQHGPDSIHSVNSGVFSRYIPPRTEADYITQRSRFEVYDEMVALCFPGLSPTIETIRDLAPPQRETYRKWRELCAQRGISFDERIKYYDELRGKTISNRQHTIEYLVSRGGQWQPVPTARITAD